MRLRQFINPQQLAFIQELSKGEEGDFYLDKLIEIQDLINTMPKTYQTDDMGDAAPISLHYFIGGCDFWITERDKIDEEQSQAFGFSCLHGDTDNAELGYISIVELLECNVELDLYWDTTTTIGDIRQSMERRAA